MPEYTLHITSENERLDSIAYRYLGNAFAISTITDANPMTPLKEQMPQGVELFIPIFDTQAMEEFDSLPPWKRPQEDA